MKKLLFMMFLFIGTLSFANSGKEIDPIKEKKVEATVACCQVGPIRVCGWANEPLCDRARGLYCMMRGCGGTGSGSGTGGSGTTPPWFELIK